jgi:hypothetical protein
MKFKIMLERESGHIEAVVTDDDDGYVIQAFVAANRKTLKNVMKKAGLAFVLPRGFVK